MGEAFTPQGTNDFQATTQNSYLVFRSGYTSQSSYSKFFINSAATYYLLSTKLHADKSDR
ncbi:hypothetical protein EYF80_000160 [Liparis tanakae]|uniref:Uncharacterized protein n=1 Tax=Liparis tanakae TaxID=230148 RepID=A0A4Z2JHW7_9TELE|nr:hypothetical protein EYF80_000160 [Liparis tanakae]